MRTKRSSAIAVSCRFFENRKGPDSPDFRHRIWTPTCCPCWRWKVKKVSTYRHTVRTTVDVFLRLFSPIIMFPFVSDFSWRTLRSVEEENSLGGPGRIHWRFRSARRPHRKPYSCWNFPRQKSMQFFIHCYWQVFFPDAFSRKGPPNKCHFIKWFW